MIKTSFPVVFNTSKIQFKSNSQPFMLIVFLPVCCVQYLKDTIQKQFTTPTLMAVVETMLCSIPQRYNSKAIHNIEQELPEEKDVVFNTSKIQFKSNSQLESVLEKSLKGCVQYLKDTIQKQFTTSRLCEGLGRSLCSIPQRYNSKAIHNCGVAII